jgi:hypothetical protein
MTALAAAYVVALQALLLPLSIAAGESFGSSLCVSSTSVEGQPASGSHESGCPCAAGCGTQCCVQTLAGPSQFAFAPVLSRAIAMGPTPVVVPAIRLAERRPQIPRAPPVA